MQAKKKKGKRLELYLVDGDSTGAIEVDIVNSNFKLVSLPNEKIKDYHKDDVGRGFYLLVQQNSNVDKPFSVYVGESKNVLTRTVQHQADTNKEFERIILAYTSDDALNTNLTQYIEEKLIKFCDEHPLVNCTNKNKGQASKLKRKDEDTCEELLEQFALVLSALGYYFIQDWELEPHELKARYASMPVVTDPAIAEAPLVEAKSYTKSTDDPFDAFPIFQGFQSNRRKTENDNYIAYLKVLGKKNFILQAGSYVRNYPDTPEEIRDITSPTENPDWLRLNENFPCSSLSYAVRIVFRYSDPPYLYWQTANGETLEAVNARLGDPLGRNKA